MDYKTVMVSLALDRSNEACLAVAGDIAERFGARIVGIAASDLRPTLYFAEGGYAEKALDQEEKSVRKRLSELESEFRSAIEPRAKTVERILDALDVAEVGAHADDHRRLTHHKRARDAKHESSNCAVNVAVASAIRPCFIALKAPAELRVIVMKMAITLIWDNLSSA